jgi:hypothetical protein
MHALSFAQKREGEEGRVRVCFTVTKHVQYIMVYTLAHTIGNTYIVTFSTHTWETLRPLFCWDMTHENTRAPAQSRSMLLFALTHQGSFNTRFGLTDF